MMQNMMVTQQPTTNEAPPFETMTPMVIQSGGSDQYMMKQAEQRSHSPYDHTQNQQGPIIYIP